VKNRCISPLKLALHVYGPGPHLTHDSLNTLESTRQTASRSVQPFCSAHGRYRQTDRPTDHATMSVAIACRIYTVNHEKRGSLFLTITLDNLNRFLYFLYHFNREEILHATVVKFTTSP